MRALLSVAFVRGIIAGATAAVLIAAVVLCGVRVTGHDVYVVFAPHPTAALFIAREYPGADVTAGCVTAASAHPHDYVALQTWAEVGKPWTKGVACVDDLWVPHARVTP
jgi:hypothetical protein